jgi:hypothetical protein
VIGEFPDQQSDQAATACSALAIATTNSSKLVGESGASRSYYPLFASWWRASKLFGSWKQIKKLNDPRRAVADVAPRFGGRILRMLWNQLSPSNVVTLLVRIVVVMVLVALIDGLIVQLMFMPSR